MIPGMVHFYAVEDRIPQVYPWMDELHLVSASAEVSSAPQEPYTVSTPSLPGGIYYGTDYTPIQTRVFHSI